MRRCDQCGCPQPGTGERFVMTGFEKGWAWGAKGSPLLHIGQEGDVSVTGVEPEAERVWTDVPVVERTCVCAAA